MKHGVLDKASLHIMHNLRSGRCFFMDAMDYVMYRLGKKENGLQIFYHCLRKMQFIHPSFRRIFRELERGLYITLGA